MKKKILILAANPTDTSKLRLDEEVREIQAAHRKARNREEIEIISEWAVRVDDLRSAILYHKPNIVHFSGHGAGDDGLLLENQYAQKQLVNNEFLAGLFKTRNNIECVVLNACYSEVQAEIIHEHINCVIGTNQAISDEAAIEFAKGFYDALINGQNYQVSFDIGCNTVKSKSISESQKIKIKIKDISQSLLDSTDRNSKPKSDSKLVHNIPKSVTKNFVGRLDELDEIHQKLHESNSLAISAVSGMGGVGKTELAIKYAWEYIDNYPGGICWLNVRDTDLAREIIKFVQLQMDLEVPQKDFQGNPLTLIQQVAWCWQHWQSPSGLVLLIFDDVTNLEDLSKLLPSFKRFRVLITTRLRYIDVDIEEMHLDVLSAQEALELFKKLIGERKVNKELETAEELCKWLGYLPLGIELVGRYIKKKPPHFTLKKMLEQLQQQRLYQEAINNPQQKGLSTAQLGVLDAFELSWIELSPETQEVARLLSIFAADVFDWEWVESTVKYLKNTNANKFNFEWVINSLMPWSKKVTEQISLTDSDIKTAIDQLYQRHLVQSLKYEDVSYYQIHPLIREFLQVKLQASPQIKEFKQAFASTFIEIAQTIPDSATREFINSVKNAIPHLTEVAENHLDAVSDENLYWAFTGLATFYDEQGLYTLAEPWYEQCVSVMRSRLGENHPHTATSLNNLAYLYESQGKYEQAEPLYIQALELRKQLLGENHPHTARSLSNLASLYYSQGKYEEAEPLFIQALQLTKQLLGENHPDTATSLNNLAALYKSQGKYEQAEPLYIQALELRKQLLGENHPDTARSLSNLASLYYSQGKYEEAEPLFIQALQLTKQLLGEKHPDIATSLNNLALLYKSQGKYEQAERLYIQAVEIAERVLGENHPLTVTIRNNLEYLRAEQGEGGNQ